MQGTGRGSLHNPLLQICLIMTQVPGAMQPRKARWLWRFSFRPKDLKPHDMASRDDKKGFEHQSTTGKN